MCIRDRWYLFDNDGVMQTGWANDNMVYLGDDGAMRVGWLLLDPPEDEYYDDDDDDDYGPFASNEGFDVNGKYWYYFKTDGEKFVPDDEYELRKIDGDYYCFDEYGRMRTGWINVDGEDTIKMCIRDRSHPVFHMEKEPMIMDYLACGHPDVSYHGVKAWCPEFENFRCLLYTSRCV